MSVRSLICALAASAVGLFVFAPGAMAVTISGDFDNDGFDDLAVGAPREDVGPDGSEVVNAGAVNVIYGAAAGIGTDVHQFWHQNSQGVEEVADANDSFGAALASGDFNGDGFDDLAIGVPGEDVGTAPILNAGAVNVLFGTARGLSGSGDQLRLQLLNGLSDVEPGDRFGFALAAADFKGGLEADLAIGAPFENVEVLEPDRIDTGRISVHDGAPGGVTGNAGQSFYSSDRIQTGDRLGTALAAGQFGVHLGSAAPRKLDLVAGAPGALGGGGRVEVFYFATSVFTRQLFTEAELGLTVEAGDAFGSAVAVGEFGDGARDDLAIGAPLENIEAEGATDAGIVGVFYGKGESLSVAGTDAWDQENAGVGTIESGDRFGAALTTGDFGRSQQQDLAIGSPLEDIVESENQPDAGYVAVLYGDATAGLAGPGDARVPFNFNYGPIAGGQLGAALGAGNFGDSARDDLAAGAPQFPQFPSAPQFNSEGLIGVLYGRGTGISQGVVGGELELFNQDEVGGVREAGDQFGAALAPAAGRTLFTVP